MNKSKNKMNVDDFERICFLLFSLGFNEYLAVFEKQNQKLVKKLQIKIEFELKNITDDIMKKDLAQEKEWSQNFCNQISSKSLKTYLEVFLEVY